MSESVFMAKEGKLSREELALVPIPGDGDTGTFTEHESISQHRATGKLARRCWDGVGGAALETVLDQLCERNASLRGRFGGGYIPNVQSIHNRESLRRVSVGAGYSINAGIGNRYLSGL